MNEFVQVEKNDKEGYWRAVEFESWTAAFITYCRDFDIDKLERIERHGGTDEVFGLLEGCAYLIIAGDGENPAEKPEIITMEKGVMYNVKKDVWHQIVVSRDASVFIVENSENHQTVRKMLKKETIDFVKNIVRF